MKHSTLFQTEEQISFVKSTFAKHLARELQLTPVSAPMVVLDGLGINDDLSGHERPVRFPVKQLGDRPAVVVHSLAKWKRQRLQELQVATEQGILTDMRALRPDEDYSPIHSIYVDQWDWEQRIEAYQRSLAFLKNTVKKIYSALVTTETLLHQNYPEVPAVLPQDIFMIHAEELLQMYPDLSPKQREHAITKQHGAVFIIGVGHALSHGEPHDGRAPDYDDWSTRNEDGFYGLNGDILVWHPTMECALELSSMGIRVDKTALEHQLAIRKMSDKAQLHFHQELLNDRLPQSIGGGIGQSRTCLFMLKKMHIGQVQVSIWPEEERRAWAQKGIYLL